jgi:hypothetical protein
MTPDQQSLGRAASATIISTLNSSYIFSPFYFHPILWNRVQPLFCRVQPHSAPPPLHCIAHVPCPTTTCIHFHLKNLALPSSSSLISSAYIQHTPIIIIEDLLAFLLLSVTYIVSSVVFRWIHHTHISFFCSFFLFFSLFSLYQHMYSNSSVQKAIVTFVSDGQFTDLHIHLFKKPSSFPPSSTLPRLRPSLKIAYLPSRRRLMHFAFLRMWSFCSV